MPGLAWLQLHDAINLSLSSANSCLAPQEQWRKWQNSPALFVHSPGRAGRFPIATLPVHVTSPVRTQQSFFFSPPKLERSQGAAQEPEVCLLTSSHFSSRGWIYPPDLTLSGEYDAV